MTYIYDTHMTYILKLTKKGSPGPDGVHGYQIKNLSNLHNRTALQLDRCLQKNNLPK